MAERADPERIEVELTSVAPDRPPSGPERTVVSSSDEVDDRAGRSPSLLPAAVTVAAVAALALVVGVLIGRAIDGGAGPTAAGDGAASTERAPTTTSASTSAAEPGLVPLPAAPALTAPATTRPIRRPTFPGEAGHLPEPESETVMVAAGLADLPIELVGLSERGLLVTLDPATGRVARRKLDRQTFGSPGLAAGEGWLLISGGSGDGRPLLVRDDGTARSVDPGISWPILIAPGTDRVWRAPLGPIVGPSRPELVEVSLLDGPTGVALPVLGDVLAVDPLTGGLAVDAPGGTYIQTVDGVQRLTSGRLIGLGRDRALVNECDEQLVCGYVVVDRMTAERRPLAVDRALGDRTTVQSLQWWALPEPMSPVGNRLLVATWDQFGNERPSQGILDLETGAYTVVTENIVPMAWGPNGDIVFFLESGRLFAFDVVTGETVAVAPDLDRLAAFTWRHDLPSVEG